jgi:hypothetical protein
MQKSIIASFTSGYEGNFKACCAEGRNQYKKGEILIQFKKRITISEK